MASSVEDRLVVFEASSILGVFPNTTSGVGEKEVRQGAMQIVQPRIISITVVCQCSQAALAVDFVFPCREGFRRTRDMRFHAT